METRRISPEVIREMRWGYVPNRASRWFHDHDVHDLSGRIIMPLYDAYGELLALTARDRREPDAPFYQKHWNEAFEKRHHLFGLNLAKKEIVAKNAVVVVEGQFDVAYLRTIGIKHVVAAMGGAFSDRHASLLARYCSNVYLFGDGDEGGRKATRSALAVYNERGLADLGINYFPVDTPAGKDPDDFTLRQIIDLCMGARDRA